MNNTRDLMKTQTVYKVLVVRNKNLHSAFVGNPLVADYTSHKHHKGKRYVLNRPTKPFAGTKLFAFLDERDAREYAYWSAGTARVYKCAAKNVVRNGWLRRFCNLALLQRYFSATPEEQKRLADEFSATITSSSDRYPSAVVCDEITPLERLT